ncbi:glycerophosphoryl diester phosphodiesterase membrane domain-containing protein [Sphingomonas sp. dw_22]|uniref:glycerophosphoryl diester phosphodiesterase membrane domain-containing protein n=1 Tax=Sphingomonas sp. dw_22 TaxID=2721175 RepID=UPI001BD40C17|nr:glycerophosphoryl diester phosphodiesterase membrane domain-containing protein [Sphingomonas sp. dw_22]
MEERMKPGGLIGVTLELLRNNAAAAMAAFAGLVAVSTAFDVLRPESYTNLPASIAGMLAQFILTKIALDRLGVVQRTSRGTGPAFIGLSILTNLGILAGLVLLVLPGIYLVMRWSASVPILIAEESGPIESIGESWRRTNGHVVPITIAYLFSLLPLLGILGIGLVEGVFPDLAGPATALGLNLFVYAWLILSWYLSIAIYLAVSRVPDDLEQVFA